MTEARYEVRSVVGLALLILATPAPAQPVEEVRAQLQALRAEQARIDELSRALAAKLAALEARTGVNTAAAANEPARLTVTGDVRLRTQGDYADNARDRESGQVRARFGATYKINETVTVGGRLATGDPDDPNSTDVQLSNFADDLQATLDQAYVQLDLGNLDLFGGKIPQPFTRTDLVWDSDVNPQGVSAIYKRSLGGGAVLRANGLFFIVDEDAVAADSTMTGAQLGYDFAFSDSLEFDLSVGYYDYTLGSVVGGDAGDFRSNLRNTDGSYRSDFDLVDAIVAATWSGLGGRWPVRVVGDYVRNLGAIDSQDTAYGVDLSVGRTSQARDWRVTYGYSVAERESVLAAFSHDNIALGTGYRLHALTFEYAPLPKTLVSGIWYHYKPYQPPGAAAIADWIERIRVAFTVSF